MKCENGIVSVGIEGPPKPSYRLLLPTEVKLGPTSDDGPCEAVRIARTEPQRLLDVRLGFLGST